MECSGYSYGADQHSTQRHRRQASWGLAWQNCSARPWVWRGYASPLQRTAKTAEIIAPGFPIIFCDALKERGIGKFKGRPASEVFNNEIDFLDINLNSGAFGVEPIQDFHARAADFLQKLQASHSSDAQILVITSNGLMKRLVSIITKTPAKDVPNFQNAEIYEYDFLS